MNKKKKKEKKGDIWEVVWGREIGEILEWCEKRKWGCG